MFGSYSEVRSNTSIAIENSLRLSISPSIVRFTTCVRNRRSRVDETKPGLFTTRANWSRTAVAGTGSAELARDFPGDEGGVGTCLSPIQLCLNKLRVVTVSLRRLTANRKPEGIAWSQAALEIDADQQTNRNSNSCVQQEPGGHRRAGHRSA